VVEERCVGLRRSERLVEKPWRSVCLARVSKKSERAEENTGDAGNGVPANRRWRDHGNALRERGEASAVPQFAKTCHRPFRQCAQIRRELTLVN
jgi:hypothetical protein